MRKISEIMECKKHYDGCTLIERMQECHIPAISIATIENFKIADVYTHGVKSRKTKEKVTPDTLFQAASISKPVFAAAVMRLVERGLLDLDTDISEYLTGYVIPTFDNQKHKITLKQILSHHAGLNLHGFAGYQKGQKIPTVDQILCGISPSNSLKLKLVSPPETGFQYSGGGYVLAQKIVTEICKQNFIDAMHDLVLSPLSMTHSTFSQPLPKDRRNEIAVGYNLHDAQLPGGYNIMPELSAAGLWTTPSDLAGFGIAIMKAIQGESKFLSKASANLMTTKAYENSQSGIGFVVKTSEKGSTFEHGGSNFGYKSIMQFRPADGSGITIMLNSDIGGFVVFEVARAYQEIYGW